MLCWSRQERQRINNEHRLSSWLISEALSCLYPERYPFPITLTDDVHMIPTFRLILPLCVTKLYVLNCTTGVPHVLEETQFSCGCCVYSAGLSWYTISLAAADTNLLCGGLSCLAQDLLTPSFTVVAGSLAESTSGPVLLTSLIVKSKGSFSHHLVSRSWLLVCINQKI